MATAADDAAVVGYLVSLTKEQRRAVASVSRSELLTSVSALSDCQRCGFVEQVLAALNPELAAIGAGTPTPSSSEAIPADALGSTAASGAVGLDGCPRNDPGRVHPGPGQDSATVLAGRPTPAPAAAGVAELGAVPPATAGPGATRPLNHPQGLGISSVMAPAQVLALLSARGGSSDLVGLLQFDWRGAGGRDGRDGSGNGGGQDGGDGGSGGDKDRLVLSESLLGRPRLLRRFLTESVAVMQALADDVGDCRRHSGYPGPAELASTLARLDKQRCHTLERLAAWGVLRTASSSSSTPGPAAPGSVGAASLSVGTADSAAAAVVVDRVDGCAGMAVAAVAMEEGVGKVGGDEQAGDIDSGLALAIQLSLRDSLGGGLPAAATSPLATPLVHGRFQQSPQQPPHDPQRRAQRTPPRPTGGALTAGSPLSLAAAAASGWGSPAARAGGGARTALVPSPGRPSPGSAQPPQSPSVAVQPQALPAASLLPAAEAIAAAEGLADASVLVDGSAVAALSEGLRERVQHLVAQLVQVQQRRGRLQHACQHGILAAGRKLLLILLQLLWTQLRRAAATAAAAAEAEAASAAEAAASPSPSASQGAAMASPPPSQRRRPRYEGLLADLAAGLGDDDTYLDLVLDSHPYPDGDFGLDQAAADLDLGARAARGGVAGSLGTGAGGAGRPAATGRGDGGGSSGGGWDAALAGIAGGRGGGATYARQSSTPSAAAVAHGASVRHSWTPLLPSPAAPAWAAPVAERQAAALPRGAVTSIRASLWESADADGGGGGAGGHGAGGSSDTSGWVPGGGIYAPFGVGGAGTLANGCACQPGCAAEREQQAEQLRALQGQLVRCQASQSELQVEVGRLLDMMTEQRRTQEQATAALRRDLARWQADPGVLQGLGAEELGELAARMEAALSRVRAAQLQAAAERDQLCPVCWEARKGLVFGCGHQTCCACGERLSACPICREPVSLRIRVYS